MAALITRYIAASPCRGRQVGGFAECQLFLPRATPISPTTTRPVWMPRHGQLHPPPAPGA